VHTVTIDGKQVKVPNEATILDAARKAGVWIPTLCFHPAVSPSATCRLCLVELDRGDWRQLVTACNYPVRRDITVYVSSETAVRARRGVMKLLLARSPESEELRALAKKMSVDGTPYPTVTESQRNCILCGLCTCVCEEVIGASAIGFAGRGVERAVTPPFRLSPDTCIACGACAAVCPVGTIRIRLHEETNEIEISPFKARVKLRVCPECGARVIPEPVAKEVFEKVNFDWDAFRDRALLCPACRRKRAAAAMAMVEAKKRNGRP